MRISSYFQLSLTALRANKVRSFLTTLGIIIGVITVIMVFALGESMNEVIEGQIEAYGSNTIFVEAKVPGFSDTSPGSATAMAEGATVTTLKEEDMEAAFEIPGVTNGYAAVMTQEKVISIYDSQKYLIQGTSASFIEIDQSEVATGRFFTETEDQALARVAVLGQTVTDQLFPGVDPIGQTIRIKGVNFKIIGVMEKMGVVFFQDMDKVVYLPLNTTQKLVMGIDHIPYFLIQVKTDDLAPVVKEDMVALLDQRHDLLTTDPDRRDFRISTMAEAMETMNIVTGAIQILLAVLAVIALIVGGLGVMNVMFVAVTERTREIGLRRAVGASARMVLNQFLCESVMITVAGAIIGVLMALILVYLSIFIAQYMGVEIDLFFPWDGVSLAVMAAIIEGFIFGLYPARKAAKLNPIESLRFE